MKVLYPSALVDFIEMVELLNCINRVRFLEAFRESSDSASLDGPNNHPKFFSNFFRNRLPNLSILFVLLWELASDGL